MGDMDRRAFIGSLAALAVAPSAVSALPDGWTFDGRELVIRGARFFNENLDLRAYSKVTVIDCYFDDSFMSFSDGVDVLISHCEFVTTSKGLNLCAIT